MSVSPARLWMLQQQAGAGAVGPAPARGQTEDATAPASPSIAGLRRLLGLRGKSSAPQTIPGRLDRSLPGRELAPGLRLVEATLPVPAPACPLSLAFSKRPRETVDPRALLFFDTETTGLAGGSGTRAFMIGAADWPCIAAPGGGLRVRQLLITTMAAEPAMLETFAAWLAPGTVLSSYNGRCYDAPLLKARYRLARLTDPLHGLDHVDLLFPSRRRWRGRWQDCRLATIEREALGVVREDDLPGAQAPAAWLQYLRGGAAARLRRVLAHNRQDVVTLSLLIARLAALQAQEQPQDRRHPPTAC